MSVAKKHTLEDTIVYQMAECSLTEVAKQLQFVATEAHQSPKTIAYTQALKAYLIDRINNI